MMDKVFDKLISLFGLDDLDENIQYLLGMNIKEKDAEESIEKFNESIVEAYTGRKL